MTLYLNKPRGAENRGDGRQFPHERAIQPTMLGYNAAGSIRGELGTTVGESEAFFRVARPRHNWLINMKPARPGKENGQRG